MGLPREVSVQALLNNLGRINSKDTLQGLQMLNTTTDVPFSFPSHRTGPAFQISVQFLSQT